MKKAQRILNELIMDLKNGNFKYEPKGERKIDWGAYNTAKINEVHFFITFVKEAVDRLQTQAKESKEPGRPPHDAYDLAKIILVQTYFQVGERQAAGLAMLFKEKLNLTEIPAERTIGRAYARPEVQAILGKVFEMTITPIQGKETSFSADGTGMPLSIKQNYANDREEQTKHAGYDKMVVMISNSFHIATSFVHAEGTTSDCPLFEPLLEETNRMFPDIDYVQLDAGFLSRNNCVLIGSAGAEPYIYPKKGITINKKGSVEWRKMLEKLIADPQSWLEFYHERSNSECYFSAHKRRFTKPLQKKTSELRGVESFCRVIVLNIAMLISAYFEHGINVEQFDTSYF